MKLLVVGASGMLGHMVTIYLRQQGNCVDTISYSRKLDSDTVLMDISNRQKVREFPWDEYDTVVNCAAMLVKNSEDRKAHAILVNAWFPHELEQLLLCTKTRIIQVSSDGVFSGKQAPYAEKDPSDCQTFYGKTKFLGELDNSKDLTVRGSFVGPELFPNGRSLFHWFVTQTDAVHGYAETYFNGITSLAFAEFVNDVLTNPISGILHIGAEESISKAEFLKRVKETFNLPSRFAEDIRMEHTDHTLRTCVWNAPFRAKGYEEMLEDLYEWMRKNRTLYEHYSFLGR